MWLLRGALRNLLLVSSKYNTVIVTCTPTLPRKTNNCHVVAATSHSDWKIALHVSYGTAFRKGAWPWHNSKVTSISGGGGGYFHYRRWWGRAAGQGMNFTVIKIGTGYLIGLIGYWRATPFYHRVASRASQPGCEFSFPKQYCTVFVWGDLDREQISVFDLNSDEINRSVHYVHHILEQKRSHENSSSRDSNPRQ